MSFLRLACLIVGLALTPAAAIFVPTPAAAAIVPAPDIDRLTELSTVVVLGELVTVDRNIGNGSVEVNGMRVSARIDRGTLRIDESLRGAAQSQMVFNFMVPLQDVGWRIPAQQEYSMFFFGTGADGNVTFAEP